MTNTLSSALEAIEIKFAKLIANDPIVRQDFERLTHCVHSSEPVASQYCKKIIAHLIGEVDQGANDDTRMADESPTAEEPNEAPHRHAQHHIALKHALAEFNALYFDK